MDAWQLQPALVFSDMQSTDTQLMLMLMADPVAVGVAAFIDYLS